MKPQRRHVLVFMACLGCFNIYSLRVNMSIAIVAMTQNVSNSFQGPAEFSWDNKMQGYLLSSFFYGYVTTQLLGGVLARKFGGKWIFGGGIAVTGAATFISPWLAEASVYLLMAARIVAGLCEGLTFSSSYALYALWIPPLERARAATQSMSGNFIGAVFSMMFYAYLSEIAGWRSIFWFSGSMALVWFALWAYLVYDHPQQDPYITDEELKYIETSLSPTTDVKIKWKHLLRSGPVWALNIGLFCDTWGFYTLLTLLPKFFKDVFQFDISKSGVLSALPYIAVTIMMHLTGQLADFITRKSWISTTNVRKLFMLLGFLFQFVFIMGAAFWADVAGTVVCLVMAMGMGALALCTISVNSLDIAPAHASVVFGAAMTMGSLPGVLSPIVAGYVISTDNPTREQWRIVFYITAALYLFGAVYYTLFSSAERQDWDEDVKSEDAEESVTTI